MHETLSSDTSGNRGRGSKARRSGRTDRARGTGSGGGSSSGEGGGDARGDSEPTVGEASDNSLIDGSRSQASDRKVRGIDVGDSEGGALSSGVLHLKKVV